MAVPDPCAGQACGLAQRSGSSENDYYVMAANGNANTYTLTATASGPQLLDNDCRTMTINSVNQAVSRPVTPLKRSSRLGCLSLPVSPAKVEA